MCWNNLRKKKSKDFFQRFFSLRPTRSHDNSSRVGGDVSLISHFLGVPSWVVMRKHKSGCIESWAPIYIYIYIHIFNTILEHILFNILYSLMVCISSSFEEIHSLWQVSSGAVFLGSNTSLRRPELKPCFACIHDYYTARQFMYMSYHEPSRDILIYVGSTAHVTTRILTF